MLGETKLTSQNLDTKIYYLFDGTKRNILPTTQIVYFQRVSIISTRPALLLDILSNQYLKSQHLNDFQERCAAQNRNISSNSIHIIEILKHRFGDVVSFIMQTVYFV